MSETKKFTAPQFSALSHPLTGGEDAPDEACKRRTSKEGASGILTCDIDDETVETFGGPVWHASASPPVREYAESLPGGVGEGTPFDEPGMRPDIFHLRRRMAPDEIGPRRFDAMIKSRGD